MIYRHKVFTAWKPQVSTFSSAYLYMIYKYNNIINKACWVYSLMNKGVNSLMYRGNIGQEEKQPKTSLKKGDNKRFGNNCHVYQLISPQQVVKMWDCSVKSTILFVKKSSFEIFTERFWVSYWRHQLKYSKFDMMIILNHHNYSIFLITTRKL